ncbi:hypothetical protein HDV02_000294 [Globomyces sp. JEL0801]|nr:hypothetical protein HDV02_000294 [Globomyces sp. JEL0801]
MNTFATALVLVLSATAQKANNPDFNAEVFGSLTRISNWDEFRRDLNTLKNLGARAMVTDVWWGEVESSDQSFDWSYYNQLSSTIMDAGLDWVPILSTHRCGGGPGDNCDIPVPKWANIGGSVNNMFVDVKGERNADSFSPWSGDYAYNQYRELYTAFTQNFASKADRIPRIDLSAGGSGELRFPSYAIDGYPTRGRLQAYSPAAVDDFRNYVLQKYNNDIPTIAKAWQATGVTKLSDITPPCDVTKDQVTVGVCAGKTGQDGFYSIGYKSPYGKDFSEWYQGSLVRHAQKLSKIAHEAFDGTFGVPIMMKIAGVHWQYFNPFEPHGAERSAGYWDYRSLLQSLKDARLGVTFTAIEMNDNNVDGIYSGAKTLTNDIFGLCRDIGVKCAAENALAIGGGNDNAYQNMKNVITTYPVSSLTILRYKDLINGAGYLYERYISPLQYPPKPITRTTTSVTGPTKTVVITTFTSTATPTSIPGTGVSFTITGVPTVPGQSVKIAGDNDALGGWNPSRALTLQPSNCSGQICRWSGTANIAIGTSIQWKVIVTNGSQTKWECGGNHALVVSSTSSITTGASIC